MQVCVCVCVCTRVCARARVPCSDFCRSLSSLGIARPTPANTKTRCSRQTAQTPHASHIPAATNCFFACLEETYSQNIHLQRQVRALEIAKVSERTKCPSHLSPTTVRVPCPPSVPVDRYVSRHCELLWFQSCFSYTEQNKRPSQET